MMLKLVNTFKYYTICLCAFCLPAFVNAYVPLDRIIAVINDDVIMQSELDMRLRTARSQIRQRGDELPPTNILERQVLDGLIQSQIQIQLADRLGIKIDDNDLNAMVNNIAAENNVSLNQFRETLEKDGYYFEQFLEDIRNEMKLSQLRKRQVTDRIVVTEKEIDNFLANEEVQDNFQTEVRLAHLLISLTENGSEVGVAEARQVANQARKDLLAGADFAAIARSISDSDTAQNGGDLGWRNEENIPTLFADYIANMAPGDISQIIESPSGLHIIKLVDIREDVKSVVKQTRARHILIKQDQVTTAEQAREKLMKLKSRIEQGDDFSVLARANSADSVSASDGGDLGWRSPGELVPEFQRTMDALAINEVSEPFQTNFGWHIVEVLERRDFDNTNTIKRSRARSAIHQRKWNEAIQSWAQELRNGAYVEYRLDEL